MAGKITSSLHKSSLHESLRFETVIKSAVVEPWHLLFWGIPINGNFPLSTGKKTILLLLKLHFAVES